MIAKFYGYPYFTFYLEEIFCAHLFPFFFFFSFFSRLDRLPLQGKAKELCLHVFLDCIV